MAVTDLQTRSLRHTLIQRIGWGTIFCLTLTILVLLGTMAVVLAAGIQFGDMTRETAFSMIHEPLPSGRHPVYLSGLWHLGILGWCVGAAASGLAAAIAYRYRLDRRWARFLLISALFTTAMLFDDLFLLHEIGYPTLFGIDELVVLISYMVLSVAYLAVFWRQMFMSHQPLLVLAMVGFASSILIDVLPWYHWRQVFEDSPKFMGIVCWAGYQIALTMDTVDAAVKRSIQWRIDRTSAQQSDWRQELEDQALAASADSPTSVL